MEELAETQQIRITEQGIGFLDLQFRVSTGLGVGWGSREDRQDEARAIPSLTSLAYLLRKLVHYRVSLSTAHHLLGVEVSLHEIMKRAFTGSV